MVKGHDNLIKIFRRLAMKNELAQGYIFFGERFVGKATFVRHLANLLEFGEFEEPTNFLSETLLIGPNAVSGDNSIGIDAVREIKQFLYAKPVRSKKRTVVIDDADSLTPQAQSAILKIAEEPPPHSLLILVLPNPEALLQTLQSRFQKVYFSRASTKEIKDFLIKEGKLGVKEAVKIAAISFGRIGRAKEIYSNKNWLLLDRELSKFLAATTSQSLFVKTVTDPDHKEKMKLFITELISRLSLDKQQNYDVLKAVLHRLYVMSQFNVNKRLQLETGLLWTT